MAVSDQEVKRRITRRRMCACGKVYHLTYNAPINQGACDICAGKLFIRNDDRPKVVSRRLKVYHRDGKPLLDYWRQQGKLIKIDGEQAIKAIQREVAERLSELRLV